MVKRRGGLHRLPMEEKMDREGRKYRPFNGGVGEGGVAP